MRCSMKRLIMYRWLSMAMIICLLITGVPLQSIAEEINSQNNNSGWQEIVTTYDGVQNTASVVEAQTSSDTSPGEKVQSTEEKSNSISADKFQNAEIQSNTTPVETVLNDTLPIDTTQSDQQQTEVSSAAVSTELKTDRFIVKYNNDVDMKNVVSIPDLQADTAGKEALTEMSESIEQKRCQ